MKQLLSLIQSNKTVDQIEKIFSRILLIWLAFLPFHVVSSIFLGIEIGIPGVNYIKEILLIILLVVGVCLLYVKKLFSLSPILILILAYITWMVFVTILSGGGLDSVIYGGRYDFEFFFAYYLGYIVQQLGYSIRPYVRCFLVSGGIMLGVSVIVHVLIGPDMLVFIGFGDHASNWSIDQAPPFVHGIPGASIQRFQGILDGPNQMAFFLITYISLLVSYLGQDKRYHFLMYAVTIILLILIVMTYSRSAYIGVAFGGCIATILIVFRLYRQIGVIRIWKKYKNIFIGSILVLIAIFASFMTVFAHRIDALIHREGSTSAHIERAIIGWKRFTDQPLGSGLASAGPASRSVYEVDHDTDVFFEVENQDVMEYAREQKALRPDGFSFTSETYYIPESWFVQQLVEGGIIGFLLFCSIMFLTFLSLIHRNIFLASGLAAVLTMNLVLHSFETMYASLVLFFFMGLYGRDILENWKKYRKKAGKA